MLIALHLNLEQCVFPENRVGIDRKIGMSSERKWEKEGKESMYTRRENLLLKDSSDMKSVRVFEGDSKPYRIRISPPHNKSLRIFTKSPESETKREVYLGAINEFGMGNDLNPILDSGDSKTICGIFNITRLCDELDYIMVVDEPSKIYQLGWMYQCVN